jgi:hypothetical protein
VNRPLNGQRSRLAAARAAVRPLVGARPNIGEDMPRYRVITVKGATGYVVGYLLKREPYHGHVVGVHAPTR